MKLKNLRKNTLKILVIISLWSCSKSDSTSNSSIITTNPSVALDTFNISYGNDDKQKLDLYLPQNRNDSSTKLLVLIHGGAWMFGDKADMNNLISKFKTSLNNYAIANINYRLGVPPSTNLWPTQYNDVKAAFDYLNNNAKTYHYNIAKTAVYGESAGSQLCMLKAYKDNANGNIKTVINIFGPNDMSDLHSFYNNNTTMQPLIETFLAGTPNSNPTSYQSASPIAFVSNASPSTISFHGSIDATVPVRQSITLDSLLKTKSVNSQLQIYAGEGHGFANNANQIDAFTKAISFLNLYNK